MSSQRLARAVVREVVDAAAREHPPESPRHPSARVPPGALGGPDLHDRVDAVDAPVARERRRVAAAAASQTTSTGSSACLAAHEPSLRDRSDARTIHGLASSSTMTGSRLRLVSNSSSGWPGGVRRVAFDGGVAAHGASRLPGRIGQSSPRTPGARLSIRTYVRYRQATRRALTSDRTVDRADAELSAADRR